MTYAFVLKEFGYGCDYTIGCGTKIVPAGETLPTDQDCYDVAQDHGLDRIESVTVVKVERVLDETAIARLAPPEEEEEEDEHASISPEEAKEERRRRYVILKREFGDTND